jgi:hypothetical protein
VDRLNSLAEAPALQISRESAFISGLLPGLGGFSIVTQGGERREAA